MKESRQDQNLADIKVGKKMLSSHLFLQTVHFGKAIKRPTWAYITAVEVSFLARTSLSINCSEKNIAAESDHKKKENMHERRE